MNIINIGRSEDSLESNIEKLMNYLGINAPVEYRQSLFGLQNETILEENEEVDNSF